MRIGLVSALFFGAVLACAPVALADPDAAHPWDSSWAGGFEDGGDGVQLIVAGNEVIGFFYHGDYIDGNADGGAGCRRLAVIFVGARQGHPPHQR